MGAYEVKVYLARLYPQQARVFRLRNNCTSHFSSDLLAWASALRKQALEALREHRYQLELF